MKSHVMDKSRPRITVVTPSFNQGQFISEAIESVVAQDYSNAEHWIIDGGSNDETLNILQHGTATPEWNHVKWNSEPDSGQSAALNKGFRLATGEIIGWLNSDDRYRPGCFEAIAQAFAANPEVDVLYGDYTLINEAGGIIKTCKEIEFNRFVLNYHRVLYIATTATFFRRRIFTEENWLNENLHYAMDAEYFIRLATAGYTFKHIPALMADSRLHPESKSCAHTKQMLQEREDVTRVQSRILQRPRPPFFRKKALSGLKIAAALLRYSEKMARGYYNSEDPYGLVRVQRSHGN
jgi:glycosyltransferase involved in cell wall biosynthesis